MKIEIPPDTQTAVFQNKGKETAYFAAYPGLDWRICYPLEPNCEYCLFKTAAAPLPPELYFITASGEEPDINSELDTSKHHFFIDVKY